MIRNSVIKSWAEAICNIAIEENKVDLYVETSKELNLLFKKNKEIIEILKNKFLDFNKKEDLIDLIFKDQKIELNFINAIKLITKRDLIESLNLILKETEKKLLKLSNITKGIIYSTEILDKKIIEQITLKIEKKFKQKIVLENKIDETLLAGIIIEVGTNKFDLSVKGKIQNMKNEILQNRN